MTSRADAEQLDATDPLRDFYDRFLVAPDGVIYLDGNSLGRLPKQTQQRLAELIDEQWGQRLIRGWSDGWIDLPTTVGDLLGENLLGAAPGQTLMADSTTVCFYKLASAALAARPGRREIVTDHDNFPTDRYVLEGLAKQHGLTIRWIHADPANGPDPQQIQEQVNEHTALVTFSHVNYRSAFILDMAEITRVAHEHGALASGTSATAPARSRSSSIKPAQTSRSAAPTSTSTAAPARPPICMSAPSTSRTCTSRSGAGLAATIRSRWRRATSPATGSCPSCRARRRCSGSSPRSRGSS